MRRRASEFLGRSQSAVSQQVRRIETQLGVSLFCKQGRGLAPTEAGEVLLAYARRLLSLNDETVAAVRGCAVEGAVRFGLPGDLADGWLPQALGRRSDWGRRNAVWHDCRAARMARFPAARDSDRGETQA